MADLDMSLQYLKGFGPARFEILQKLGLNTVSDILNYFPRNYEDRGTYKKICEKVVNIKNAYANQKISKTCNSNYNIRYKVSRLGNYVDLLLRI